MPEQASHKPVGVIGAGSFGTAIANLIAYNSSVLLYSRNADLVERINTTHQHLNLTLSPNIVATSQLQEVSEKCTVIFPIVPSVNFRQMMQELGPFLRPYHILIHGTKGFDFQATAEPASGKKKVITRDQVSTMSEVIQQESVVLRVGCLSGPNLAKEIMEGQPTATVIGSHFKEVIKIGKNLLSSKHFHVFGTHDLLGAELAGALKNIIAIGSGILGGLGMGKNIQALLITRGLLEMIHFGQKLGANSSAFLGTAGIGDLVATATSKNSRNYTFGFRLGQGEKITDIQATMPELAEGVRTLQISQQLAQFYKLRMPITQTLYNVVFENYDVNRAIEFLIKYPYDVDVDFL